MIGVVPAAGRAERLGWLPCSKELLPLLRSAVRPSRGAETGSSGADPDAAGTDPDAAGTETDPAGTEDGPQPEPVCYGVLRALARAGIERAYMTIRSGKWDVPAHLRGGDAVGLALSYLVLEDSPSAAHSIDAAYPFTADAIVALGFPDVLLRVDDPFRPLLEQWYESEAEVVLGLFPPSPDYHTERVSLGEAGLVTAIDPVPVEEDEQDDERPTWTLAVWGPAFGRYLHGAVVAWDGAAAVAADVGGEAPDELVLGDVFRRALTEGIAIHGLRVSEEPFMDVGDPDRLMAAMRDAYRR